MFSQLRGGVLSESVVAMPSRRPVEHDKPSSGRPAGSYASAAMEDAAQSCIDGLSARPVTRGRHVLRFPPLESTVPSLPDPKASRSPPVRRDRPSGALSKPDGIWPDDQPPAPVALWATGEKVRFSEGRKPTVTGPAVDSETFSPPLAATPGGVLSAQADRGADLKNTSQNVLAGSSRWPIGSTTALRPAALLDEDSGSATAD